MVKSVVSDQWPVVIVKWGEFGDFSVRGIRGFGLWAGGVLGAEWESGC